MRSMNKNTRKFFESFEEIYTGNMHRLKELTGFGDVDNQISGLHRGDLVAVVGEPGSGKTSFLANIVLNIADQSSQKILFYSLQYPAEQLIFRMICVKGNTSAHEAIRGYVTREDWHAMTSAAGRLCKAPLLIEDGPIEAIESMLKKLRRCHKKIPNLKLIVIDSIDMVVASDMAQYSECLRKLKSAAVDLCIPILISAAIRKEQAKTKGKTTICQERLEAIETYADTIMHIRLDAGNLSARYNEIYRKKQGDINRQKLLPYIPEIYMAVRTEISVIKNTYGPRGSIFLTFIPQQYRFESDERAEKNADP